MFFLGMPPFKPVSLGLHISAIVVNNNMYFFGSNGAVNNTVISKQADRAIYNSIKNSMGARTVPWGTPDNKGAPSEEAPSRSTI